MPHCNNAQEPNTNSVFAVRSNASNQSGLPITNNVVQFIYNFSLPGIVIATRNCDLCNDHCPQHCRRTFGIFCFDQHPAPLVVAIDMMVVQSKRDLVCVRQRTKPMIKQVLEVQRAQINVPNVVGTSDDERASAAPALVLSECVFHSTQVRAQCVVI